MSTTVSTKKSLRYERLIGEFCAHLRGEPTETPWPTIEVALAEDVRNSLSELYLCPVVPERHAALPSDDNEVVSLIRRNDDRRLDKLKDRARIAFARWRWAVMHAELLAAKRLNTLLWAIDVYEKHGGLEPQRDEVQAFVVRNYGMELPLPKSNSYKLERFVQRLDILSVPLRHGERKKKDRRHADQADQADMGEEGQDGDNESVPF